jgi:hypothetical protein
MTVEIPFRLSLNSRTSGQPVLDSAAISDVFDCSYLKQTEQFT